MIKAGRRTKRALIAIAHAILVQAHHIIKDKQPYRKLDIDCLDKLKEDRAISRIIQDLTAKGYKITPLAKYTL